VDLTRWDGRLVTSTVVITTLVVTGALFLVPLPGLPGSHPGVEATAGTAGTGSVASHSLVVVPGDRQLYVSWALDSGGTVSHADVLAEAGGGTVPCMPQMSAPSLVASCLVTGLVNGASYLVSLHRGATGTVSLPLRTIRAVPRPKVLGSPDVAVWLDASDYRSVSTANGGRPVLGSAVSALRDRSTHGRTAVQADPARRPVLDQLGMLPALRFDGADSLLLAPQGFPDRASTVLVVASEDDARPDVTCFRHVLAWGAPAAGQARILNKGCRTPLIFADTFNTSPLQVPTLDWPVGQPAVVSAVFATDGTSVRVDGSTSYRWKAPPAVRHVAGPVRPGDSVVVGAAPWDMQAGWNGRIGELLVFDRALTPVELASVESYLLAKWRVTSKPDAA
jgi:hypothetical protein